MALSITNTFAQVYFTCDIPNLNITTTRSSVEVTLRLNSTIIFTGTYYASSGTVVVRDIASIFESYYLQNNLSLGTAAIAVSDGANSASASFTAIYCRIHCTSVAASDFLSGSFFTTALVRLTTIQCPQYLSCNLANGTHNVTIRMQVQRPNGEILPYAWVRTIYASDESVTTFDVHPADMQARAANLLNIPEAKLLSYTVSLGNRTCSFYVQHVPHSRCFLFRNIFNCQDAIAFPAETTTQLETDFSEALVEHTLMHYDIQHTYSYETKTGELLTAQASFIEQFITSPKIQLNTPVNGQYPLVLISDYEHKISDAPGKSNTISFTWQLADKKLKLL